MDTNQQGVHAFASKQGQEQTIFSCKLLLEVT